MPENQNLEFFEKNDPAAAVERYRLLIEQTGQIIYDYDIFSGHIEWTGAIEPLTGFTVEDFRSTDILGWEELIHPDDRDHAMTLLYECMKTESKYHVHYRFRKKDDEYFYVEDNGVFLRDSEGEIIRMIGTMKDVSSEKKMEEHLRQVQKMDSIGTLAGGIAHDFNNILNIIVGSATLLQNDFSNPEKNAKRIENILKSSDRGSGLVRQLLTFARKNEMLIEAVKVNEVIRDLVKMVAETFPKGVDLKMELAEELPVIFADVNHLHQVLLNLCVNSRDAMPDGGTITLRSREIDRHQVPAHEQSGSSVRFIEISVSDTGLGMDKATQQRIFEPFFTTKGVGKGTGLGLSVVFGIIQNHKGTLSVDSTPGAGSTFKLYFPVPDTQPASDDEDNFGSEIPGGTETILLADDEWMIREIVSSTLEAKGYTVIQAEDGQQSLETFIEKGHDINLLITDLEMPRMGGADSFTQMKTRRNNLKAVVISGYISPELRASLTKAGVKALIHKPFKPEQLLRIIRGILDKNPT
ncbi:MAG: PAS domain-containing protein [Bacteroidetes bacterium]|nr:PAS domain-containing protein [Bacteroidota bacterium]